MKTNVFSIVIGGIVILAFWIGIAYLILLIVKVLRIYIRSHDVRMEKAVTVKSLGEVLKKHRTDAKITQEFVAETLCVSRQAVSKWENGTSDPNTSNLVALGKLYGVTPEELLNEINSQSKGTGGREK